MEIVFGVTDADDDGGCNEAKEDKLRDRGAGETGGEHFCFLLMMPSVKMTRGETFIDPCLICFLTSYNLLFHVVGAVSASAASFLNSDWDILQRGLRGCKNTSD